MFENANKGRRFDGKLNANNKGENDSLCIDFAISAEVSIVDVQSRFGETILMEASKR